MKSSVDSTSVGNTIGLDSSRQNIIAVIVTSLLLIFFSAWLNSYTQSRPGPRGTGREPPVAPYSLPYLQHLIPFLRDPNTLLKTLRKKYPDTPFSLTMMNTKFHIFSSLETASLIFGKSRVFIFGPVVASMMENGLDLPMEDRPKINIPISDKRTTSTSSIDEQESSEFTEANHSIFTKYLSGKWLDAIMEVYCDKFNLVLDRTLGKEFDDGQWKTINLHQTIRKMVFDTSAITFFGTRLPNLWPNMWNDWRQFNDTAYVGVRSNIAWYLKPKAYFARRRMLESFQNWVDCEIEGWDGDHVWNDKWGVRMNMEREMLSRKFNFTKRGRACQQASFLFVIITNAAPMATWFTLCVIQSSERLARFRTEASKYLVSAETDSKDLRFDITGLKSNQYIQGLWKEALRLGSISSAARVVTKDTELEGYVVKKGSVVLLPVCLMHSDPDVFPSPEKFDPERWILPADSASDEERASAIQKQKRQAARMRSFGGGTGLCSGRFVAEQEILSTVSTMLLLFDIEFEPGHENFSMSPQSLGIMSPTKEPRVRIRRRYGADVGDAAAV